MRGSHGFTPRFVRRPDAPLPPFAPALAVAAASLAGLLIAPQGSAPEGTAGVAPRIRAERGAPPIEAWREDWAIRTGGRPLPVDAYERALEAMDDMPRRNSTRGREELPSRRAAREAEHAGAPGPDRILEGQVDGWIALGPGNLGGRTRSLVLDAGPPLTLYAGGVAGGVWKADGETAFAWRPTGGMANLAVTALALHPTNRRILYAGTGEGLFQNNVLVSGGMRGAGLFKTTDGGDRWFQVSGTANDPDFHYIWDIALTPRDHRVIYLATRTGVWRSLDLGRTFGRIYTPPGRLNGCQDLAVRVEGTRDVLFAACGFLEAGVVVRTTDAAAATPLFLNVLNEAGMGRAALSIAPSNPQVVYAVSSSLAADLGGPGPGLHAVFRSTTGGGPGSFRARVRGTSASRVAQTLLSNPSAALSDLCVPGGTSTFLNQGWWDMAIAVDPADANRVWVGGVDLFRSDNAGAGWARASYWDAPAGPRWVHADQHVIAFHPAYDGVTNKVLAVGNDGGVYFTLDARRSPASTTPGQCGPGVAGSSQVAWAPLNHNYQVAQFYRGAAAFADGTRRVLGGAQDLGVLLGGATTGVTGWANLITGDGGAAALDPGDPSTLYASTQNAAILKSTDGGGSWNGASNGLFDNATPPQPLDTFPFVTYFVMDPSDSATLWTGGFRLWRTSDGAANWTRASTQQPAMISAIAVNPGDSDHVVAATLAGRVLRQFAATSATATTSWLSNQSLFCAVTDLAFDPSDTDRVFAACGTFGTSHVWRSVDRGRSFLPIDGLGSGRLPDLPVLSIAVDPDDGNRLFVGTDLGVFSTVDGGSRWAVETTGFPNTRTVGLEFIRRGEAGLDLFATTHGRGAWVGEVR